MGKRARKKPAGVREPGESDVLPDPIPAGQLGDWLEEQPEDLKEAAIEFEKMKNKAKDAVNKFEEAKAHLDDLRKKYNVSRVRIGASTSFIEFKEMGSVKFKIVKMNKPQEVVEAERAKRDQQAGDVE